MAVCAGIRSRLPPDSATGPALPTSQGTVRASPPSPQRDGLNPKMAPPGIQVRMGPSPSWHSVFGPHRTLIQRHFCGCPRMASAWNAPRGPEPHQFLCRFRACHPSPFSERVKPVRGTFWWPQKTDGALAPRTDTRFCPVNASKAQSPAQSTEPAVSWSQEPPAGSTPPTTRSSGSMHRHSQDPCGPSSGPASGLSCPRIAAPGLPLTELNGLHFPPRFLPR